MVAPVCKKTHKLVMIKRIPETMNDVLKFLINKNLSDNTNATPIKRIVGN